MNKAVAIPVEIEQAACFGIFTEPGTADDYLALVENRVSLKQRSTIFYHNLHTVYCYVTSEAYKKSFDRTTVIVDGMGVLLLLKLAGYKLSRDYRLTYVDFIMPMMQMARDKGWRVFHIGQDEKVMQKALDIIRAKVPGIQIEGQHGFFDLEHGSDESNAVIDRVNKFETDLLLVGLGTPKQELWISENRDSLNASVVMACGSCMEYLAGKVKTAPRWMGRAGLEWLFRLFEDPKRFAFRYLVQPFLLIFILIRNTFKERRRPSS